ncbi:uncharacterized protein [Atheta coriaria]|uniref:uncharacterized protein n=1 Tax=Dalotia coriaria TaxID=877792 RepID=UPI0031F3977A
MYKLVFLALIGVALCAPQTRRSEELDERIHDKEIIQNESAQYQFASNVEDHINDQSQQRVEVRDGLNVKGMYSYSDGYFKRTVQYEADDKGYRVIGEEVVPLEGPKVNLNGMASVAQQAHGTELKYTVQSVQSDKPTARLVDTETLLAAASRRQ